jgi:hypothetical protein
MDGGRHGERVAAPELYGFAAENIFDAFRDVHTAAGVGAIENPLFHIQIPNSNTARKRRRRVAGAGSDAWQRRRNTSMARRIRDSRRIRDWW